MVWFVMALFFLFDDFSSRGSGRKILAAAVDDDDSEPVAEKKKEAGVRHERTKQHKADVLHDNVRSRVTNQAQTFYRSMVVIRDENNPKITPNKRSDIPNEAPLIFVQRIIQPTRQKQMAIVTR